MYSYALKATLTELHRKTATLVRPVIHGGQTIILTAQGKDCAKLAPWPERKEVTAEDLQQSEITDQAILAALAESRE